MKRTQSVITWGFCVLFLVAGVFGWAGMLSRWKLVHRAQKQQDDCMEHLRLIGKALTRYQAEHGGHLPKGALTTLVPRYLPDTSVFICPTVQGRSDLAPVFMPPNGQMPFHYIHIYLARDFPAALQIKGEKAPVVGCVFHTYEAVNGLTYLILRKDGEVEAVPANKGPDLSVY